MLASASFSSKRPLCLPFDLRFRSPCLWFCLRCYIVNVGPDLAGKNPSDKISNRQPIIYRSLYERKYEEIYGYKSYYEKKTGCIEIIRDLYFQFSLLIYSNIKKKQNSTLVKGKMV